jgi:ATP-dependent helicase/DNAse subunit B
VPLTLLVGPANAGKVAGLLDRYVAALDRDPFLVVPNRGEVERVERDLLERMPGLLGGSIGTFDDLFRRVATGTSPVPPLLSPAQRRLLLTRVIERAQLGRMALSARFGGFAEGLADALAELGAGLVEPDEVEGDLGALYAAYRTECERLGATDPAGLRRRAAELVASNLGAWQGAPVLVYGFEDLSTVQWRLLEALAARVDVTVSLPYEPGRAAFAALEATANDLAALADPRIEELPARGWYDAPSLAYLERTLFTDAEGPSEPLDGAVRFLEAAGTRAALELVGAEILDLLRGGIPGEEIGVVCPSVEQRLTAIETAFEALGVPYAVDAPLRLGRTSFGRALLGLCRFAWLGGERADLYRFLRSPYSGLARQRVDMAEGRLRGRAVRDPTRVEEETLGLLGHRIPALDRLREEGDLLDAIRAVTAGMLAAAWGTERPPLGAPADVDLRAEECVRRLLGELDDWPGTGGTLAAEELIRTLEQAAVTPPGARAGRVLVLDLLRVRTRRFRVVFVLGLEEGVLPRRPADSPFLTEELRRGLAGRPPGRRLLRADALSRDRYLFYTACTRPWSRLYLVREAATDDGRPLEPSSFWEEVRGRFASSDVERFTTRRPLSALSFELHLAPNERERLRAVAVLASQSESQARALAAAGGWERRIERALSAFQRPTRLANPAVLRGLGEQTRFSATELEKFVDCSSMWLVERVLDPKTIDPEIDARVRGIVAHQALRSFYAGLPRRFGVEIVGRDRFDEAVEYLRECLREAIEGQVRLEVADVDLLELEAQLGRDLELFLRSEIELGLPLVPRRFEVSFGTSRSAPELQSGLDFGSFTVSGKIDRIDLDPYSASGLVQDYKSGEAFSASRIESERRLQMPLYILALRDLVGLEPLGGIYRSLTGEREARGMARLDVRESVPGLKPADYLDEEAFWDKAGKAVALARSAVEQIRHGDVGHNPRFGDCPTWCEAWPICRVRRP